MPRFLNAGVGIAGVNSRAVCNTFDHINAGAPYSAIYVFIFLKYCIMKIEEYWLKKGAPRLSFFTGY